MTKLDQIKSSIEALPSEEVRRLRAWLEELEERLFDDQIEHDAKSGKLDDIAQRALADHKAGQTRKL